MKQDKNHVVSARTRVVVGLAVLDIARQVSRAWASRRAAESEHAAWGRGFRKDVAHLARDTRDSLPDHLWPDRFERGIPRWHAEHDRLRVWSPIAAVVAAAATAILIVAHRVAKSSAMRTPEEIASDSRVVGVIRAGGTAIDAGVSKVAGGGKGIAVSTASVTAAGSSALKTASTQRAKHELDARVMRPLKKKAIVYGSLGVLGLTIYVVLVVAVAQALISGLG